MLVALLFDQLFEMDFQRRRGAREAAGKRAGAPVKYVEDVEVDDRLAFDWPPGEENPKRVEGMVRIHSTWTKPKFITIGGFNLDPEGLRARKGKTKKKTSSTEKTLRVNYNDDAAWNIFATLHPLFIAAGNATAAAPQPAPPSGENRHSATGRTWAGVP